MGAIPFAVFTVLTFMIPDFSSSGKLVWAYVTYCLLCTAYTVVNIPLNTIVPRLTSDVHERDVLVSTRMVCAMIGTAVVMTITMPLVKFFGQGNDARGYLVTMSIFLLNLFYFSLYVVRSTTVIYYFKYNLGRENWLSLVGILGILSGLPMLLLLPELEKRFKKKNLMFFSAALYAAGDLVIFAGKNSAVCLLVGLIITGLGIYGIFGITFAMQPDVIDYSEYKKQASVAGLIAALQGFFVKGGMGITSFMIGVFLKSGGYAANSVQTPKALSYIEICFIWIPIVLCAGIAVLTHFYKLDGLRTEMTIELDTRRNEIVQQAKAA